MVASPNECAREVLDVVPLVMRAIRAEFRRNRGNDLRVPQFRALAFINRSPGASLSELSEHLGLTPPSTSTLIDGLVGRGLVLRLESPADRRRLTLNLTEAGSQLLQASFEATQACLADLFSKVPDEQCMGIQQSMQWLRAIFTQGGKDPQADLQKGPQKGLTDGYPEN